MLCDHVGPNLVDFAEGTLDADTALQVRAHVDGCADCRADLDAIHRWRRHAAKWHEAALPAGWTAFRTRNPVPWHAAPRGTSLLQWLPLAASVAALAVSAPLLFERSQQATGDAAGTDARLFDARLEQWQDETWERLDVDQSLLVAAVLEATRNQRRAEMEALARVIKGEMDRQSLVTEERLRYVIGHQIDEQQRLDALARHVNYAEYEPPALPREARP